MAYLKYLDDDLIATKRIVEQLNMDFKSLVNDFFERLTYFYAPIEDWRSALDRTFNNILEEDKCSEENIIELNRTAVQIEKFMHDHAEITKTLSGLFNSVSDMVALTDKYRY